MFKENEINITDVKAFEPSEDKLDPEATFKEIVTVKKLCAIMGWNIYNLPKLAKKSYTYDMREILGQLTPAELEGQADRKAKELKVARGKAKIKKLLARAGI